MLSFISYFILSIIGRLIARMFGAHEILSSKEHNDQFHGLNSKKGTYTIQDGCFERGSNWRILHVIKATR